MPSLLFVCTANRFRSPLAAVFFRNQFGQKSIASQWKVDSAGTWAEDEMSATREAIFEAKKRGIDLQYHISKIITKDLIDGFDLILVMEMGHKEALLNEFPEKIGKVFLLSEFGGKAPFSIPDPYESGESPEWIANEIEEQILMKFDDIFKYFNLETA